MSDTPTNAQHFVWTYNDSDEWLDRNASIPDMLLGNGMSERDADTFASRLAERYPTDTFEVRDVHGDHVRTYGTVRRALGRAPKTTRAGVIKERNRRALGNGTAR